VSWGFCCEIGSVAGTISGVVLSLRYRLVTCLFGLLAVLVCSDLVLAEISSVQVKKFMDHVVVLPWRMNYGSLRAVGGCE
jgi:hypothetical protein